MDNVIEEKSFRFAIRIVNLYKYLCRSQKEFVLSRQALRSGTSIALKETSETKYWLRLLKATGYLSNEQSHSVYSDCIELEKLLVTILKTTKQNM